MVHHRTIICLQDAAVHINSVWCTPRKLKYVERGVAKITLNSFEMFQQHRIVDETAEGSVVVQCIHWQDLGTFAQDGTVAV